MHALTNSLEKSLLSDITLLSAEMLEGNVDDLISNSFLKNIPILNIIGSTVRFGRDIHERNLYKQTLAFLIELNSGNIDRKKLTKYAEKIKSDKTKEEELERVLLILNNNIDIYKSSMLGRLFVAYVNQDINWDTFCEYTEITNRLFMEDFRILSEIRSGVEFEPKKGDKFRIERVYSSGIIGNTFVGLQSGGQGLHGRVLNDIGKDYCNIVFGEGKRGSHSY